MIIPIRENNNIFITPKFIKLYFSIILRIKNSLEENRPFSYGLFL